MIRDTKMIPIPQNGKWVVGAHEFNTNAQAWRWIDRQENEPISRAEDLSDWVAHRILTRP